MARFYEHLQEIRSVKRAASYAKYLKKHLLSRTHTWVTFVFGWLLSLGCP